MTPRNSTVQLNAAVSGSFHRHMEAISPSSRSWRRYPYGSCPQPIRGLWHTRGNSSSSQATASDRQLDPFKTDIWNASVQPTFCGWSVRTDTWANQLLWR